MKVLPGFHEGVTSRNEDAWVSRLRSWVEPGRLRPTCGRLQAQRPASAPGSPRRTRASPRAAPEAHLPGSRGEAPELALDVNERGAGGPARFVRKRAELCVSRGAAARQGPAAWLPAAGGTGADPRSSPVPRGRGGGPVGSERLRGTRDPRRATPESGGCRVASQRDCRVGDERSLTAHSVLRGQGAAFLTRGLSEGERPPGCFV